MKKWFTAIFCCYQHFLMEQNVPGPFYKQPNTGNQGTTGPDSQALLTVNRFRCTNEFFSKGQINFHGWIEHWSDWLVWCGVSLRSRRSRSVVMTDDITQENSLRDIFSRSPEDSLFREKLSQLCASYLGGVWEKVNCRHIQITPLT